MNVLVIDVGGNHVKTVASGEKEAREFPSGPTLTPKQMVMGVKKVGSDWKYKAVSIGIPGRSSEIGRLRNRITLDAAGWDMTSDETGTGAPS